MQSLAILTTHSDMTVIDIGPGICTPLPATGPGVRLALPRIYCPRHTQESLSRGLGFCHGLLNRYFIGLFGGHV
jgi:hypothetical protein